DTRIEDADIRLRIEDILDSADTILMHLSEAMRAAEKPFRAEQEVATFGARVAALARTSDDDDDHSVRDRRFLQVAAARVQRLAGQLCSLVSNSDWASRSGEIRTELAEARLPSALRPRNPWQTLRANLKTSSMAMRHAIRCAVSLGLAVSCERA